MSKTVIVYTPDGKAEKHTLPNARDLVNGAGFTWKPGVASLPTEELPVALKPNAQERLKLNAKAASQEIFDRYGSTATPDVDPLADAGTADEEIVVEAAPEVVEEVPEVVEETPEVVEEIEEAPTSVELPRAGRGRGRGKN